MTTTPTQLPVPSEKPQDLKFNAGKIDEFVTSMGWTYTDRFGNKHYTIEGINYLAQQVMNAFGYITLTGVDFDTGATVSTPNEVLFNPDDNSYYKWTGSFASGPKIVPENSTPESTGGIGPGKWLNVGDANLRGDINKAFNGSKVCFIEAWGDDSTAKIGSSIYPFKTIGAAISGSTGPATFKIGEGVFTWGGALRNNLSFIGAGQPTVNADATALVGGTILQSGDSGGFPGGFTAMNGISFCNLGVVALGKTNGLQLASPGNTSPGKNISVKNITVLCNPTTDHAILLENIQYLEFENIITYGGVSGLAVKALDFTGRNLTHYDASGAGLTIRESPYAKCKRGIVSNVRVDRYTSSSNSDSSVQLLNNEEGAGMRDITIDNIIANSSDTAVFINGQNNTSPAESISINNIKALQSKSFALYITGNVKSTSIKGLETYNCVAISNIEVNGTYAPTDTLISGINDNAGVNAVSRPILNDGVRTTISCFKTNITGMDTYNPVIENPGTGTTLSGFTYTGSAITDTGSGNHTILEGEEMQGIPTGPATPGKCIALKKSNGLLTVNIVNAIVNSASTDIALPFNMRFKSGSTSDPTQIRQNYNIKLSWYVNATSPTIVSLNAIAYPLTESTFRVILSGDPSAISTGAVISAELSGLWK